MFKIPGVGPKKGTKKGAAEVDAAESPKEADEGEFAAEVEAAGMGLVGTSQSRSSSADDHPLKRKNLRFSEKVERAAEEGGSEGNDGRDTFDTEFSACPKTTTPLRRVGSGSSLSTIAKKYDLDGKGTLDDTEKMMRAYDKNNDGKLDMREIYNIVQELREQQRELNEERMKILDMRRAIIFLCVFTLVLTLAMLGMSFVAARLAKDTSVTSSHALADKYSGESLSTIGASKTCPFHFDENRTQTDEGQGEGEGEGPSERRRLLPFSSSRTKRMLQQRMNERHVEKHGRELFGPFGGNRKRDGAYSDSHSDDNGNRGRNSQRNSNTYYNEFDSCARDGFYEGTVDYSTFQTMQFSARAGHSTFTVQYELDGFLYSERIALNSMYIDTDNDVAAIEADIQVVCFGRYNRQSCEITQPFYTVQNCRWDSGGGRSGGRGRGNGRGSRNSGRGSVRSNEGRTVCDMFRCDLTTNSVRRCRDDDDSYAGNGRWFNSRE